MWKTHANRTLSLSTRTKVRVYSKSVTWPYVVWLTQAGEVRPDAHGGLRAAVYEAEARDHLVEYEDAPTPARQAA